MSLPRGGGEVTRKVGAAGPTREIVSRPPNSDGPSLPAMPSPITEPVTPAISMPAPSGSRAAPPLSTAKPNRSCRKPSKVAKLSGTTVPVGVNAA